MEVERVTTFKQLDEVMPFMFEAFQKSEFYKGQAFSAYFTNCVVNLPFQDQFALLMYKEGGKPVGFLMASISKNNFDNVCTIVDAYMIKPDTTATMMSHDMIETWATENGCKYMDAFSKRASALCKRYGFQEVSTYVRKNIGG